MNSAIPAVEPDVQRHRRTLDRWTLEQLRRVAVQRVRGGESPSAVIASLDLHRPVIHNGSTLRRVAALLIERKPGIRRAIAAGCALLARRGLMPHKPPPRAFRRDPQAIDWWRREIYPVRRERVKADDARTFVRAPSVFHITD